MTGPMLEPLPAGTIEAISRIIGEAFTGSVIHRMLTTAGLSDPAELSTKWKRIAEALGAAQARTKSAAPVVAFVKEAISPTNSSSSPEAHEALIRQLNVPLLLAGYQVALDGRMFRGSKASTVAGAQARADRLRTELERRRVHQDVLRFCRAELLAKDYFHAVFEATKSLSDKLRRLTGLSGDAGELAQRAFDKGGLGPYLLLNDFKEPSDIDDHDGVAAMLRGVFKVCRNVPAHVPRIHAAVSEPDALDLLTHLSYLHRRLDASTPTHRAKPRS